MDPIYAHAQVQHTVWANPVHSVMPMDYSTYPHPPPFTSPPATPMTPITPVTLHHAFPMPHQYEMTAPGTVYHNHPPPPPPPPFPSPPEFSHPDYRLYALCQHLQNYSKVQESQQKAWWEEFLNEFFQENATLVIEVDFGEGTRKYRLTGDWIGLYFKSLLENGVTSVHLNLDQCYATPNQNLWQLECQSAVMETHHSTPKPTKVCMSGSLVVDFSLEEKPRIISWYFHIKDHIEYVPRSAAVGQGEEAGIMGNITCRGILPATQKLLLEAGMLENTGYHESTSIAMTSTATPSINTAMHWQESVPPLIHHPQHLDVLAGPMGVLGGAVLSPDPRINQPMNGSSGSSSSNKQQHHPKSSRSSSHHGGSGKKKSSPIPASSHGGGGGSNAGKELFVLVAAEAMPLASAEDFMSAYSIDERTITRVNNKGKSRAESTNISNGHHLINGQTASSSSSSGSTLVGGGKVAPHGHITHLPRPDACLPDGGAAQDGITSSPLPPTDSSWVTPTDTLAISVTSTR